MAIPTMSKKRDRVTMTTSSSPAFSKAGVVDDEEEYERAVSFLREFRSRNIATDLHCASLDAILEADCLDDALARDFAVALSVGNNNHNHHHHTKKKPTMMIKRKESFARLGRGAGPNGNGGLSMSMSRMKKATTTKCLLDLDDDGSEKVAPSLPLPSKVLLRQSSTGLFATSQDPAAAGGADDYYLGYDDVISSPMTKRHRCSLLGHRGFDS